MPIIKLIERAGYTVWWDGLIGSGDRFAETTAGALEVAKAVVVLWSATSVGSHWVQDEAARGRDRGCLVPVTIDGTMPPLGFGQFQTIDLAGAKLNAKDPAVARLLNGIAQLHDRAALPVRHEAGLAKPLNRRLMLGGTAGAVAIGAGLAAWHFGGAEAPKEAVNSVAVIPFRNLSGDAAQDYLSEGLSEEVRTVLAQNSLLKVVAQASSRMFREGDATVRDIASQLGVAFVLTGSIRKAGDTLRIAARLTDGASGADAWTQGFDRPVADVLAVQREIANKVADALTARIGAAAQRQSSGDRPGGTSNVAAYDAYLKGQNLYYFGTSEADERAGLASFEAAIALDPGYAAAHAARARAIPYIADNYGKPADLFAAYRTALDAARQAVRLAPEMAEGHSALGYILFTPFLDAKAARASYERSIALAPGEEAINSFFARYSALAGRKEAALKAATLALSLSPLDASVHRGLGRVHFWARRYDDALPHLQQALVMSPGLSGANATIGTVMQLRGRVDEALEYHKRETYRPAALTGQAIAEQARGNKAAAQQAMAALVAEFGTHGLYQQAQILAQWGQRDEAIPRLQQALPLRDSGLVFLLTDPLIDPLRGDPRLAALLSRIGMA